MVEGLDFLIPSSFIMKGARGRLISLPQAATGLRFACRARSVGGAFSRTTSWRPACAAGRTLRGALRADLLMPQEALLRRGRSCKFCISTSIAAPCVYRIIAVHASNRCNACFIILIFAFAGSQCRIRQKGGR